MPKFATPSLQKASLAVLGLLEKKIFDGPEYTRALEELKLELIASDVSIKPKRMPLLCYCGEGDCMPGFVMCPECIARDNDE